MGKAAHISVCIPAYDMGGQGARFLRASFERLAPQSFQDFEVVVSDQSDSDDVARACQEFESRITIRRVDFRHGPRQASANCNNAIRHAGGRIIKVLFQDDFLCDDNALHLIFHAFEDPKCQWLVTGAAVSVDGQTIERPMVPRWHDQIRYGRNTISSPSVLAFRAGHDLWFDEALIWLMDVDMFQTCKDAFGLPVIVPDILVANRLHEGQVSAGVTRKLRRHELLYTARKGGLMRKRGDLKAFLYQYLKALG